MTGPPPLDLAPLPASDGRRAEQVMEAVREALDAGVMQPGVKYSVYQLAAALGVSRTPVRDALLRLEEVGLIGFEARQGFRVRLPDPREIAEIFAIRLALEPPAAARAASGCDDALAGRLRDRMAAMQAAADSGDARIFAHQDQLLHDDILVAAHNGRARAIVRSLRETTRLLGATTERTMSDIDAEHRPVVDAIIANRPSDALRAMRSHLTSTGVLLVTQAVRDQRYPIDAEQIWAGAVGEPQ
ncbi:MULTISPECIES: GntR family transcriptional regulator [Mycobacteriaceae]|uniref:GntR family transcriptional regulator n=1 Tax=Mycobacteriaceae TaxID=1762 RepID=UPI0004EF788E|nr:MULTISPECIES: GntR family transcriptional regulator [Mycobacteriaceae]AHC26753.2 GntR family transcriptional regulator [Mycolicibacterium neoaurum VKM Ac-1815D]AMO08526.1 GntR family transcriptional regulator [Mycolicibacterium neoaurum]AXK78142.1 GntR family transcriptional regulator [Mycolicibacterium neoaurum]KJQ50294.1 GntR family transcriptional regulator [Mycolicibacterium neoaurum]KUM06868.1 GntR family transcriptional regulator [Mycolicibacterium neoaurum]